MYLVCAYKGIWGAQWGCSTWLVRLRGCLECTIGGVVIRGLADITSLIGITVDDIVAVTPIIGIVAFMLLIRQSHCLTDMFFGLDVFLKYLV